MDVEVNRVSKNNTFGTLEDCFDNANCMPEWVGRKAGLQLEVEEDYSLPPSPDCNPIGPPGQEELTIELQCEEEEGSGKGCKWTDSAIAGVFITSSTNFDLQCEDEDLELRLSEQAKGACRRPTEDFDGDIIVTSPFDEEDLVPTSGDALAYHCEECGEDFRSPSRLQTHQKAHRAEHSYRCPICSKEFFHMANFKMHKLIHSSDRPYKCPECDKGFMHKIDLSRHLQNVHKIEHSKKLSNKVALTASLTHHSQNICLEESGGEQAKPFLCCTCGKGFRTSNLLSKHKVIHRQDKPFRCEECGKAFVQLLRLKRHQKIHTGERPFHCGECSKPFTCLTSLHRHQRIHTGEKPYSCTYCAQDFTESGSLRRHERSHQVKAP